MWSLPALRPVGIDANGRALFDNSVGAEASRVVLQDTGLLPHVNAGVMSQEDIQALKLVTGMPSPLQFDCCMDCCRLLAEFTPCQGRHEPHNGPGIGRQTVQIVHIQRVLCWIDKMHVTLFLIFTSERHFGANII